jgi:hypothetical protein
VSGVAPDLERHLVDYALDQLGVLGRAAGLQYVRGCLDVWRREYGDALADKVAAQVRAAAQKGRP